MERPDGLSTTWGYQYRMGGGKQGMVRNTVVTKDDLGTIIHNRVLKSGNDQSMVFMDTNLPPFVC